MTERDANRTADIDNINKRLRTIVNEIDDLKRAMDGNVILAKRVEGVEAKAQDLWVLMGQAKKGGGSGGSGETSESILNEFKLLHKAIFDSKYQLGKRCDELKAEI